MNYRQWKKNYKKKYGENPPAGIDRASINRVKNINIRPDDVILESSTSADTQRAFAEALRRSRQTVEEQIRENEISGNGNIRVPKNFSLKDSSRDTQQALADALKQREEEQRIAEEAEAQRKQELNDQRKLMAQRMLSTSTGNKLGKILALINPELAVFGEMLGTTVEVASQACKAIDEMATRISKMSASAKLLGIDLDGVDGSSELHKDIQDLKVQWQGFIEEVEIGITRAYDAIQQTDRLEELSNEELAKESGANTGALIGTYLMSATNPLFAGAVLGLGVHQEALNDEIDNRIDKEKKINEALEEYGDSLQGVAGANDSLMTQLVNIVDNNSATEGTLLGLASSGSNILKSQGVNNKNSNLWISQLLGFTDKLYRDMDESVDFSTIYSDVENALLNKNLGSLNKYGLGVSEESVYGYAMKYKDMNLKSTTYRDDKMTELYIDYFNWFIHAKDEEKEAMYDLGYEIKNNTNAIKKWQWIENIGGLNADKGRANYDNFFAVDSQGKEISDKLYGTETERLKEELQSVSNIVTRTADTISIDKIKALDVVKNSALPKVGNTLDIAEGTLQALGLPTNDLSSTIVGTMEKMIQNIQVNVTASDNLKVEIKKSVTEGIYNSIQDSFTKGNIMPMITGSIEAMQTMSNIR